MDIIYQDPYFVAVNKPAGLLVHRSPIDTREKRFAIQTVRNQIGRQVFPVHRLDRPTSGVLLFALASETARMTAELFQTGAIRKKYIAVVRGYADESGIIDYPLKEIRDKRIYRRNPESETGYPAVTEYRRLATVELAFRVDKYPTSRYSLVELFPATGRRHQLRRHMKHIAHPIIGDTKHGQYAHNAFFKERLNCGCLLLTAVELTFRHPVTGSQVTIFAELGNEFRSILKAFGWEAAIGLPGPYPDRAQILPDAS